MSEQKTDLSKFILPVGALLIIGTAAQKFGLLPSNESNQNKVKAQDADKFLNKDYLKKIIAESKPGTKYPLLTQATAKKIAQKIYDTKNVLRNDKVGLVSIFKNINYRTQISQVAGKFYELYSNDLFVWLKDNYSDEILAAIFDVINEKPIK